MAEKDRDKDGSAGPGKPEAQPIPSRDRRAHRRVEAALQVTYKSIDELVSAYSRDISEGGVYIPTRAFLPAGAVVRLDVQLPDDGPKLEAIARVAYILDGEDAAGAGRPPGMGMEFLDVGGKPVAEQVADYLLERVSEMPPAPGTDAGALVLVVDDSEVVRERAAAVMRSAGNRVVTAKNGVEALGIALRDGPDLIITDAEMPAMDGWQLLRLVRTRTNLAHVPVVFLTRLTSDEERLRGYQLGVDDYVGKPFTDVELVVRVQRVLERARAEPAGAAKKALRGDLSQVSLASLLSLLDMERRTGHLIVIHDDELARLSIRNGSVVRLDLGKANESRSPLERFFYLLDWTYGQFELTAVEVTDDDTVNLSTSFVLIEHARRVDEAR